MKALITGASSGIGRDIAHYLSHLGHDLILVARRKDKLEELKKELKTDVKIIALDLQDSKNVFKLYNIVEKDNIDILINNAGFGLFGDFIDTDLTRELEMIDLNIKTVHILTKLFLNYFKNKKNCYILNVASSAGFLAGPHLNAYYATKNYVLKLTMAIYQELKEKNINVNISALCPGPVQTEFNKVAKGIFAMKGMNSKYVAKYAIDNMFKKKLIIVPGWKYKMGIFFNRFIPYKLQLKIISNVQIRKNK